MNIEIEEETLAGRIAPPVKSLKVKSDAFFKIADGCKFTVSCPDGAAAAIVSDFAKRFWEVDADVSKTEGERRITGDEAYAIDVSASEIAISAATARGVRYAMFTLRQLAESERGVARSRASFIVAAVEIEDEPAMKFRGIHICFFPTPESGMREFERQVRMAAYYKYNYVVIETWGSLKFKSHPEFSWPGHSIEPGEMKRIVDLAKGLGVTPIPQLNIFGHASAARGNIGKHALLDLHPEFAPLFEPDGWCWCLSNPETRRFLSDLAEELIGIFGNPPYFHIGCDEAFGAGSCALCRRSDYVELFKNHLLYFGDFLKKRGARPMLWHDMFVESGDRRWDGYVASGSADTAGILEALPKDFIVCDWRYFLSEEDRKTGEPSWATMRHFIGKGFDTIACPWFDEANTLAFGKGAVKYGAFGMLETIWHFKRGRHMFEEFAVGAWAAWNPASDAPKRKRASPHFTFNAHVRDVNHDMGVTDYEDFGVNPYQIPGPFCHDC